MFVQIQLNCDSPADMERLQAIAMMGPMLDLMEIEVVGDTAPEQAAPKRKRRSRAKPKAPAPIAEDTEVTEAPIAEDTEVTEAPIAEDTEVTEEQLRAAFTAFVNAQGTAQVLALFKEAKVKRLSELKPAQYAPFLLALSNA